MEDLGFQLGMWGGGRVVGHGGNSYGIIGCQVLSVKSVTVADYILRSLISVVHEFVFKTFNLIQNVHFLKIFFKNFFPKLAQNMDVHSHL